MPRYVRADIFHHPLGHFLELLVRVILAGNQQSGDLEPDIGLMLEVLERIEHRLQVPTANLVVELLGEGLEINIRCVHMAIKLFAWLWRHVAGTDRHGLDTAFMTSDSDVDCVLEEDHRIVIGISHAATTELLGRLGNRLG